MIKRMLAILVILSLMLPIVACKRENGNDAPLVGGYYSVERFKSVTTYSEVERGVELLRDNDKLLEPMYAFDYTGTDFSFVYQFIAMNYPQSYPIGFADFLGNEHITNASLTTYIFLNDYTCSREHDCWEEHLLLEYYFTIDDLSSIGEFDSLPPIISFYIDSDTDVPTITNAELITIEEVRSDSTSYCFEVKYDGELLFKCLSCCPIDEKIAALFKEKLVQFK